MIKIYFLDRVWSNLVMKKMTGLLLGALSYVLGSISSLYLIPFLGQFWVPKHINSGSSVSFQNALFINLLLLSLFGLQHSFMARESFKKRLAKAFSSLLERSIYLIATSLILFALFYFWQPMTGVIWEVNTEMFRICIWILFASGWMIMFWGANAIDYMDFMGFKQLKCYMTGTEYKEAPFTVVGLYRYIRHPQMVGFIIAFWAIPTMTSGHLLFASIMSFYIVLSSFFEDKALVRRFGSQYSDYKRNIPKYVPTVRPYPIVRQNKS